MSVTPEDNFFQASDELGKAIAALAAPERDVVAKLYVDVKEFASQQEVKGVHLDKAAFFAAGLIVHPEVSDAAVIQAAANLIEKDWLFVKANQANAAEASSAST